jgi:hypothetical protein
MNWINALLNAILRAVREGFGITMRGLKQIQSQLAEVLANQDIIITNQKEERQDIAALEAGLLSIIAMLTPPPPVAFIMTLTTNDGLPLGGESNMKHVSGKMKLTFNDNGSAVATLALVDSVGLVTSVPTGATLVTPWVSSDPNLIVTPATDGLSAQLTPATPPVLVTGATVTAGPGTLTDAQGNTTTLPAVTSELLNIVAGGPTGFQISVQ